MLPQMKSLLAAIVFLAAPAFALAAATPRGPREVPFTVQAPLGKWRDPVYQNACEEAAVLMVMRWAMGDERPLGAVEALKAIRKLADFQRTRYGHFHDRSAADTAQLIRDFYGHTGVAVKSVTSAADLRAELDRGFLVITPMNGRKLGNPYYTSPGPLTHMLVVTGYDRKTDEFITNDPGTRRGKNFRYVSKTLLYALRDYPTGFHQPITAERKVMIVVKPVSSVSSQWNRNTPRQRVTSEPHNVLTL